MSKPKRPSMAAVMAAETIPTDPVSTALSRDSAVNSPIEEASIVTSSRDSVHPEQAPASEDLTLSRDKAVTPKNEPRQEKIRLAPEADASATRGSGKRRSPGDKTRHTYHASLYLPDEAQFALREIALTMRRAKPHDVMLEAMADLFDRYNKGQLAEECRQRITSRDKVKA